MGTQTHLLVAVPIALVLSLTALPASGLSVSDSAIVAPGRAHPLSCAGGVAPLSWRIVENRSGARLVNGTYVAGLLDFVTDLVEVADARGDTARTRVLVSPGFSVEPYVISTRTAMSHTFRVLPSDLHVRFRLDPRSGSGGRISETGVYHSGLRDDTVDWVIAEDSSGRVSLAQVEILSDDTAGARIPQIRRLVWFGRVFELLFGTAPTRAEYHDFLADVNNGVTRERFVAEWLRDERLIALSTAGAWRGLTGTPLSNTKRSELAVAYLREGMSGVLVGILSDTAFWNRTAATGPSDSAVAWVTRVHLELAGTPPPAELARAMAARIRAGEPRVILVREILANPAVRAPLARRVINPFLGLPRTANPPPYLAQPFIAGGSFEAATIAALCAPEFMRGGGD